MKRIYLMAKIRQYIIKLVQKYKINEVDFNFLSGVLNIIQQ